MLIRIHVYVPTRSSPPRCSDALTNQYRNFQPIPETQHSPTTIPFADKANVAGKRCQDASQERLFDLVMTTPHPQCVSGTVALVITDQCVSLRDATESTLVSSSYRDDA